MSEILSSELTNARHPRLFELTKSGGVIFEPVYSNEEQLIFNFKERLVSNVENLSLAGKLSVLIDSPDFIELGYQAKVFSQFWEILGFDTPQIPKSIADSYINEFNGTSTRLLPVPTLTMAERKLIYKKAKTYFSGALETSETSQLTNDESIIYANLSRNTEKFYDNGEKKFALRYLSDNGPLSRQEYINWLAGNDRGLIHRNRVWSFVPIDFSSNDRLGSSVDSLVSNYDLLSPESLIARQMIMVASGNSYNWSSRFCNELIFEVDSEGNPKDIAGFVSLRWNNSNQTGHLSVEK